VRTIPRCLLSRPLQLWISRYAKYDLDPPPTAARTFQAALQLIQREVVAPRPYKRLHVELGRGILFDRPSLAPAVRVFTAPNAVCGEAPAEPPRFTDGPRPAHGRLGCRPVPSLRQVRYELVQVRIGQHRAPVHAERASGIGKMVVIEK
jgi:hypothetical protein